MATPTGVLWERDPHTAAKHTLLRRYMMAWFPIMATQFRADGITFLDGFAGPGEYTNSLESSPAIAMHQAHRDEVSRTGCPVRLVFIEDHEGRHAHLADLLATRFPETGRPHRLSVHIVHGKCSDTYARSVDDIGGWSGPIFANLDGWGVDTDYSVVRRIATQRSSEVLVTFQEQFFTRFAKVEDQEAGDRVFGSRDWRSVGNLPTPQKKPYLLGLYRDRLQQAGFAYVLTFEMVDEGGHSLYQFFGTTNRVAVEKFKDALWIVDEIAGQRFRDPRDPDQLSFDLAHPDFTPLRTSFLALLGTRGQVTLEEFAAHALFETIYKPSHAKRAVEELLAAERVVQVRNGRSHAEKVYALAPATLFSP